MGTGQTMLTAMFLVLLTVLMIAANQLLINSTQNSLESLASDEGMDAANQLMMEIVQKKFDANVYYSSYESSYNFIFIQQPSHSISLPDAAPFQSVAAYTSINEYNGYRRKVDGPNIKGFTDSVAVYYVSRTNMTSASYTQTYYKRIDIVVTHPTYLSSPRRLTRIVHY